MFEEYVDGTVVDTTIIPERIWCEKCGFECETEGIIVDGKPYHYECSGLEL